MRWRALFRRGVVFSEACEAIFRRDGGAVGGHY
jgi:hypothetical protein